jgi:ankyrin repeat protein
MSTKKNKNGQTLLSTALKKSDLRSFRLLIESGADPRLAEAGIKKKKKWLKTTTLPFI